MSITEKLKKYNIDVYSEKLTILDFFTDWCPPCLEIKPILERKEKEGRVILKSINLNENQEVGNLFKIETVPTIIIFKSGKIVFMSKSGVPKSAFPAVNFYSIGTLVGTSLSSIIYSKN